MGESAAWGPSSRPSRLFYPDAPTQVNLYELLKRNGYKGLSLRLLRLFTTQARPAARPSKERERERGPLLSGREPATFPCVPKVPPRPLPSCLVLPLLQILDSLAVLRDANVIHCDLKVSRRTK